MRESRQSFAEPNQRLGATIVVEESSLETGELRNHLRLGVVGGALAGERFPDLLPPGQLCCAVCLPSHVAKAAEIRDDRFEPVHRVGCVRRFGNEPLPLVEELLYERVVPRTPARFHRL